MYKGGCVYIVTNKNNTVLYLGFTSNLKQRILDHKKKKYNNAFMVMMRDENVKHKIDNLLF